MAGKKQNLAPMWKKLKSVDVDEPTSFLDRVYLDVLNVNADRMKRWLNNLQRCWNHVFLLEQQKNYRDGKKTHAKTSAWSYDMEGHAPKSVERYCELANKKVEQRYKVPNPCLDDHQFKQEELKSVGELSEVCSQIFLSFYFRSASWQDQSQNGPQTCDR